MLCRIATDRVGRQISIRVNSVQALSRFLPLVIARKPAIPEPSR